MPGTLNDSSFLALPFEALSAAALARAKQRGAAYADFRFERLRHQVIVLRDRELQTSAATESIGFSLRVIHKGAWGFAAGVDLSVDEAAAVASRAMDLARAVGPLHA